MSATHCLNCDSPLHGAYCHGCGQKGSTHRLSLGHFLIHDAVHGLWHVDGSFLYTLGQVVRRPGRAAMEYIAGKRRKFFNLITLLLLIAGTSVFIRHQLKDEGPGGVAGRAAALQTKPADRFVQVVKGTSAFIVVDTTGALDGDTRPAQAGRTVKNWVEGNQKWLLLAFIPLISFASVIAYRRAHYNYTEHLVVAAFSLAGGLTVAFVCTLLEKGLSLAFHVRWHFGGLVFFLFMLTAFWQAHRHRYSMAGWAWRTLAALLMFAIFFIIAIIVGGVLIMGPAFFDS